ncbi:hypothetical protein Hdeb2414_s0012g00384471 [Helianthus debilis subsp. tardiflorus]
MRDLVLPQFVIQRVTSNSQTKSLSCFTPFVSSSIIRKEVQEDEDLQLSMAVALLFFSFLLRLRMYNTLMERCFTDCVDHSSAKH